MADAAGQGGGARAPTVRLDAAGGPGGGRSLRFRGLRRVLRADRVDDVLPLLAAVERAAAEGLHAAGFVAYEAAPAFDPALAVHPPDPRLPLAWFAVYDARDEADPASADPDPPRPDDGASDAPGPWTMDLSRDAYVARVERIRDLIAAGDTYQVNFTARLRAPFRGDAEALYARLRDAQRSAFCALIDPGAGPAIVGASPELFFRLDGRALTLRPMKGTRPRGRWPAEDRALAAALAASEKDRAENLMIVDLLRNDAGRVAEFGSVSVERMFEVERYETVHQMTSTVRARLREDASLVDVFRALFPCGSVTGAPKVRTMEIIRDLETGPRAAYCGALGFVSPGEAVFAVGIRTLLVDPAAGTAELGVGSGITWDSDPAAEYRECLAKAAFVHRPPGAFRLLETLRWEGDEGWWHLDGHLRRLAGSAAYWGYGYDADAVARALAEAARGFGAGAMRVRLLLDRGGAVEVEAAPLDPSPEPVRVAVSAEPVDSADVMLFHKTTARAPYDRRRAARPDCGDVLLVNERGELTEATLANLVIEADGGRWTPPLDCGLLPGVLREALLARGDIGERVLRPADLARAEAVWLINSVRGWRRAAVVAGGRVDGTRSGEPCTTPGRRGAAGSHGRNGEGE